MDLTFTDWNVPMRTNDGRIESATWRQYPDYGILPLTSDGDAYFIATHHYPIDDSILLRIADTEGNKTVVGLARVEALALMAMLRAAVYPDRLPDELSVARQEVATLRKLVDDIMPRYVELFVCTGLGNPEDSVMVQEVARVMGRSGAETDHA